MTCEVQLVQNLSVWMLETRGMSSSSSLSPSQWQQQPIPDTRGVSGTVLCSSHTFPHLILTTTITFIIIPILQVEKMMLGKMKEACPSSHGEEGLEPALNTRALPGIHSLLCPLLSMWMQWKKVSPGGGCRSSSLGSEKRGRNQERSWFGIWVLREN